MKQRLNILLVIASGAMMLSWFYAWDSFIMLSISREPVPVSEAAIALIMASVITILHHFRGWRWIFVILIHSIGFILALSMMLHNSSQIPYTFWNPEWIPVFLNIERGAVDWLQLSIIILLISFLWSYGVRLATVPTSKSCINIRFDLGLASFLLLLLIKLLMKYKGVIPSYDHTIIMNFISFFILGLFSMGLVRNKVKAGISHISYYRGVGVILTFILFVILFGGGLVMLFLPGMTTGAEIGYEILRTTTRPIGQILVAILRFIFVKGCGRSQTQESPSGQGGDETDLMAQGPSEVGLFEQILVWSMIVIIAITGLIMTVILARLFFKWLLRWLLSRTPHEEKKMNLWELVLKHLAAFKRMILSIIYRIFSLSAGEKRGDYFYRRLVGWGSRSGLPHASFETPKEYGSRLVQYFPTFAKEIDLIVDMFNRSVYGGITPSDSQFSHARFSWKRLRSPLLWPLRLKLLLFSPS